MSNLKKIKRSSWFFLSSYDCLFVISQEELFYTSFKLCFQLYHDENKDTYSDIDELLKQT